MAPAPLTVDELLRRIVGELSAVGGRFAVVGGLALSARTRPRFTADVDIAIAVSGDPESERLVFEMQGRGFRVWKTIEHDATGRLATVRLRTTGHEEDPIVDLIFSTSGIEPEVVRDADRAEIGSLGVPVARAGHLVAMKLLSRSEARFQDKADLLALREFLDADEIALAREGVRLIVERGYSRGKDLVRELEEYLATAPPKEFPWARERRWPPPKR